MPKHCCSLLLSLITKLDLNSLLTSLVHVVVLVKICIVALQAIIPSVVVVWYSLRLIDLSSWSLAVQVDLILNPFFFLTISMVLLLTSILCPVWMVRFTSVVHLN